MTARDLIAAGRVLVAGHRGNAVAAPENTLPSFAEAIGLGADFVELDYRHSADGVPIVFHDEHLDRTTDAAAHWGGQKIKLAEKTVAELRQLDAGAWFDQRFAGTRIPTLEEALAVIHPRSIGLIERKVGDAATTVALLRRMKLVEQVVVQAFDWPFLAECRRLEPGLALCALGERELSPQKLDEIARLDVQAIGWENYATTPAVIEAAHARGLKVFVWTVDSLDRSRQLVAAGVDTLITNAPGPLKAMLASAAGD